MQPLLLLLLALGFVALYFAQQSAQSLERLRSQVQVNVVPTNVFGDFTKWPHEGVEDDISTAPNEKFSINGRNCTINSISGSFFNKKFVFDGPCQEKGLVKWYDNKEDVCELLQRFDIFIIGQSTERRLVQTLVEMVSGNPEAFLNDFSNPSKNGLFDEKGDIDDEILKIRGVSEYARNCLNLRFVTGQFAGSALSWSKEFISASQKLGNNGRKKVIMFQFGLYSAAMRKLVLKEGVKREGRQLSTMLQKLQLEARSQFLEESHIHIFWHPPPPVNRLHERFRHYGGEVNERLDEFRRMTWSISEHSGLGIFDIFDELLYGTSHGLIEFETGKEWTPPQHGGIHVKDSGRRLVAQKFINQLSVLETLK